MKCTPLGFLFDKAEWKALLAYASKDEHRPHLCGISFDAEHGSAFATDGAAMAIATNCGKHPAERFTVPRAICERAAKVCPANGTIAVDFIGQVNVGPEQVTEFEACHGIACFDFAAVPGQLAPPPWREVVPERGTPGEKASAVVGFDAELLARMAVVAKACPGSGVSLTVGGDSLSPMRADIRGDGCDWTVVTMPMRI